MPVILVFVTSGCSITGFGPDIDDVAQTSSVVGVQSAQPLEETVDPSDWDKVREVIQTVLISEPAGSTLPWENEVTGANGTIVAMGLVSSDDGQICRKFSTTINSVGGIEKYRGDACQTHNGGLELKSVSFYEPTVDVAVEALPKLQ